VKRVSSFDIFDTLLTRSVAVPRDLFVLVARAWMKATLCHGDEIQFALKRIEAEQAATQLAEGGQATMREIYDVLAPRLNWSANQIPQAMQVELDVEAENLQPIPGANEPLLAARRDGRQIAFITDTYLPPEFLRIQLERFDFFRAGDLLFISNQERANKAGGRLFDVVKSKLENPTDWQHFGDDPFADITMARGRGIQPFARPQGRLTRYEATLRGGFQPLVASAWQSQFAAACRFSRLELSTGKPNETPVTEVATGIAAPALIAFVIWTLRQAESHGLRRLYFLARDGQILLKIARHLQKRGWHNIECRYLAASRQAWHPAAIIDFNPEDLEKVRAAGIKMTFRNVLNLTALQPEQCADRLASLGFSPAEWDTPMTYPRRYDWQNILARGDFNDLIRAAAAKKRVLLLEYLRQEKFFEQPECGIVDIGWYGRLQTSLEKILSQFPSHERPRVRGLYFGLKLESSPDNRIGFANQFGAAGAITPVQMALLERFTAADHGSVIDFERQAGGAVEPVLSQPRNTHALDWGLETMQASIESVAVKTAALDELAAIDPATLLQNSLQALETLITHPSAEEAARWGNFPMSGQQLESTYEILAPAWTWPRAFAAIRNVSARPDVWWKQATLINGTILPIALYLRILDKPLQFLRRLKSTPRNKSAPRA
jgi:FMN phosphatase YigB (HAD superfamily)